MDFLNPMLPEVRRSKTKSRDEVARKKKARKKAAASRRMNRYQKGGHRTSSKRSLRVRA